MTNCKSIQAYFCKLTRHIPNLADIERVQTRIAYEVYNEMGPRYKKGFVPVEIPECLQDPPRWNKFLKTFG